MRFDMEREPLGVATDVTSVASLKRWSQISPTQHVIDYTATGDPPKHDVSPFPYNLELNRKLILW